eukprot:jgi/Chlat1/828/Chrsp104S01179
MSSTMRRTTLATMSPSQANSRGNGAASRVAGSLEGAKRRTLGGAGFNRPSLGGYGQQPLPPGPRGNAAGANPLARRSSIAHTMRGSGLAGRSDPRPLNDKQFQAACIRSEFWSTKTCHCILDRQRFDKQHRRADCCGRHAAMVNYQPCICCHPMRPASPQHSHQFLADVVERACRKVITYLADHGYNRPISQKLLTSPSAKEFGHIVQFLFLKIDPNMHFGAHIEDEVPMMFKRLRYPFQISKSALSAVGTPHTWPALLAALTWLVELLTYEEKADESRADVFDGEQGQQRLFFEFVGKSYQHFMAGRDDICQQLESDLAATFEAKDAETAAEVLQLEHENEALTTKLERLKSEPSPLAGLHAKKEDMERDVEKFHQLLDNLSSHKASYEKKVAHHRQDLASKESELASVIQENAGLRQRIDEQDFNVADVDRMSKEKSKLDAMLDSLSNQRAELDRAVWEQEVQVSRRLEVLEGVVRNYHTHAERLQLIPSTAKRANGLVFEIALNTRASKAEAMVTADLKGMMQPAISQLRETYSRRMREAQEELLMLQEKADTGEEALSDLQEDAAALEAKLKKTEAQLKAEKERLDSDLQQAAAALQKIEWDATQLRGDNSSMLAQCQERYTALLAEYEETVSACEKQRETAHAKLLVALDAMMNHKAYVQERVHAVRDHTRDLLLKLQQQDESCQQ